MNLAISSVASLVMDSMNRAANCQMATARSLSAAILPAFGVRWNRDVTRAIASNRINELMLRLRNSPLRRLRYDKLPDMFNTAFCNPYSLIPEWAEWKHLAYSYMLDRRFPQEAIAQTITFLSDRCVSDPGALAILDAVAIETMAADAPNAGPLRTLWRIPRTAAAALSPNEHMALPEAGLSAGAFEKAVKRRIGSMDRKHPARPLVRKQLNAPSAIWKVGAIATDRSAETAEISPAQGGPLHLG